MKSPGHIIGPLAAALLGACVGLAPEPLGADAGGADAEPPPAETDARLAFEFSPSPRVPGPFPGDFEPTVSKIRFHLQDVRAIGDAATGSTDTRADVLEVAWRSGYDTPTLEFSAAPPGLYSALLAKVVEFEITGTVVIDGVVEPFEIEDEQVASTLSIDLGIQLAPDQNRVVAVTFDGASLLADIDWAAVSVDDGKRVIDDDHPALPQVRARALAAFHSDGGDAPLD